MTFNMRNFADILASRQGGVNLKPGRSLTKEISGDQVEQIFGSRPASYAAYGLIITIKPVGGDQYRVTVRREK